MAESGARPARSREWGTCPPGRSATASSVCSWEFRAARINPIHSRAELPASSTNSPLTIRTWKTGGTAVTSTRDEAERKQKAYPSPCLPACPPALPCPASPLSGTEQVSGHRSGEAAARASRFAAGLPLPSSPAFGFDLPRLAGALGELRLAWRGLLICRG